MCDTNSSKMKYIYLIFLIIAFLTIRYSIFFQSFLKSSLLKNIREQKISEGLIV